MTAREFLELLRRVADSESRTRERGADEATDQLSSYSPAQAAALAMTALTRAHLLSLASGDISPEEASEWALRMMASEMPERQDERIWTALDRLSGADLMAGPGQYLHGKEDFDSWVAEFGGDE